jgi:hypothetical protein
MRDSLPLEPPGHDAVCTAQELLSRLHEGSLEIERLIARSERQLLEARQSLHRAASASSPVMGRLPNDSVDATVVLSADAVPAIAPPIISR